MYDEYGNLIIPRNYGRIHFGRQEAIQILISVCVITAAFSIVIMGGFFGNSFIDWPLAIAVSATVAVTGFLLHELGHKFVAQRYGAWAEYRMYPTGLFMALIFSFLGFLFAAPGAVYIQGRITKKQNGTISLAGPAINIAFGGVFLALWLIFPDMGDLTFAFRLIGLLSMFLAGFNLIPFGPLDGKKVLDWNPGIWVLSIAIAGFLLLVGYGVITFG
jgi:Zn-dependent protease